jgi:CBS domain-containing protein
MVFMLTGENGGFSVGTLDARRLAEMSLHARNWRSFRKISGVRLRPELVDALPPSARTTLVSEVMEPLVLTIDWRTDLLAALRLFTETGVHAAAVAGDDGEAVGVVSKTDVLGELCEHPSQQHPPPPPLGPESSAELEARAAVQIHDVMTPLTVAVTESTSLSHAIAVMARSGVHPVPVVAADGSVMGILSSADVLRWLAGNGIYG